MVSDTDPRARAWLTAQYRRRNDGDRLEMAIRMSEELRDVARAGARARSPEATSEQIDLIVAETYLGPALLAKVLARRR